MQALSRATNIASKKTIAKAIDGLVEKSHVAIIQEANGDTRGTWYRVFLPEEIDMVRILIQEKPGRAKNTIVENSAVKNIRAENTTVENSAVNFPVGEEKTTTVIIDPVSESIENKEENPTNTKTTTVKIAPFTTDLLHTLSQRLLTTFMSY